MAVFSNMYRVEIGVNDKYTYSDGGKKSARTGITFAASGMRSNAFAARCSSQNKELQFIFLPHHLSMGRTSTL
jgi:hypothetical protein